MSFLFPRLVRLSRPQGNTGTGAQPYGGLSQAKETTIITAARAHIQPDRQGKPPLEGLPGDAVGQPTWKVLLKLPKGTVQKRDVLTDDLGTRYQVAYAAWTPLGTTVLAVELNGLGVPPTIGTWESLTRGWESLTDLWAPAAFPASAWEATPAAWETLATPWGPTFDTAGPAWGNTNVNWESFA